MIAVEQLGLKPQVILRRLGLDASYSQNPNARLPIYTGLKFWKICEELARDPLIGLKAGCRIEYGSYPLLDYLCASAATTGEGLALFSRYAGIINDSIFPQILEHPDRVEIRINRALAFIPFPVGDEFHLAILLKRLRFLTSAAPSSYSVTLPHANQGEKSTYENLLQAPVEFGAKKTAVIVRSPNFLSGSPSREAKIRKDEIYPLVENIFRRFTDAKAERKSLYWTCTRYLGICARKGLFVLTMWPGSLASARVRFRDGSWTRPRHLRKSSRTIVATPPFPFWRLGRPSTTSPFYWVTSIRQTSRAPLRAGTERRRPAGAKSRKYRMNWA